MVTTWLARLARAHRQRLRGVRALRWKKRLTVPLGVQPLEDRTAPSVASAIEVFDTSPALFVENQGQWENESVRYAFFGTGANVLHTDSGPVFQLLQSEASESQASSDPPALVEPEPVAVQQTFVFATFDGAERVEPTGVDQAQTLHDYYVGDQSRWRTGVRSYETVAYPDLYQGIDLFTWGRRNSLKYEFHVDPGADYCQIQVSYQGIDGLCLDQQGALHIQTAFGELVDDAPYVYQEIDGERVEIASQFVLVDQDTYSFHLANSYNAEAEIIIDPMLAWSTYLGGESDDCGYGIAVDGSGNLIVAGSTYSPGWTSGGFDTSYNGSCDAFVAKLNSAGAHLWSTYLGGTSSDSGEGIAVDGSGSLIVTGSTYSPGWTSGGFDTSYNGGYGDAFVAKLSSAGAHLWSTYLGGESVDHGLGIAVDSSGNPIVAGSTESSGWTSGGFDTSYNGSSSVGGDAFVAKLSSAGAHLWSTYLGGTSRDHGLGIAVDSSDNPIVAGFTDSSGWTSGGFDTSHNGDLDAFVVKIFDFDSDNIGVHRGQMWYLDADGSQSWNVPGDDYFSFGISTDEPIVGDWDGDGYDEVGVHRGDMWYLDADGNGQWNLPGDQYFRFGIVGDEPVVGDWDGDGNDEVGVHRGSAWYLDVDGSLSWTAGDQYFRFGINGDEPLVGDWDGDGTDEVGVHRGDTWFLDTDGSHGWNAGDEYFHFGIPGDDPLVGDWNADGADEIGVRRGNTWYLDTDGSGSWNFPGDEYLHFGIPSDQPIVGRWQAAGGSGGQAGGGQASFAAAMLELPAEPGTGLMLGLLSTNASAVANATQLDNVFAAEPAALPSAVEGDTELPVDATSGQVTRSNRLGSGGLLDLPTSKVRDQVLEEFLQSAWWL